MPHVIKHLSAGFSVLVGLALLVMLTATGARAGALPVGGAAATASSAVPERVDYRRTYGGHSYRQGYRPRTYGYRRPYGYHRPYVYRRPYGYRPVYRPYGYRPYGYRPYGYGAYTGAARCRLVTVKSFDPDWGRPRLRTVRRCW